MATVRNNIVTPTQGPVNGARAVVRAHLEECLMTSICAAGQSGSPLQQLQQELQSEVSAGTISSSDQSALSSALTDIDTALQQSRERDRASGTRPSPDEMKSKIDDLTSNEASSGRLNSEQAATLTSTLEAA